MSLRPDLLLEIERFLRAARMSPTTFGKAAANDSHLVHDLRIGREPSPELAEKVRGYMAAEREKIVSLLNGDEAA